MQHLISFAANVNRPLAEVIAERARRAGRNGAEPIATVATAYAGRKLAANCMDYDDLLLQWGRLIREFPEQRALQGRLFRHLLIDEMQDTNAVQVDLRRGDRRGRRRATSRPSATTRSRSTGSAGPTTTISSGSPSGIPEPGSSSLETNYRSTPQIVAFTRASIAHNKTGFPKELVSARPDGVLPLVVATEDAYDEAAFVCQQILEQRDKGLALGQMAVLYRNHYDSILLQGELLSRGIPYTVRSGLRFFEQAHIKDVLAYLRIVVNPRDEASWRRLLLLIPGVGPGQGRRALPAAVEAARIPSKPSSRPRRWRCCRPRARASSPASWATSGS